MCAVSSRHLTALVVAFVAFGALATGSLAATVHHCGDVRMNQSDRPAAHGQFGAFGIKATGSACATARKVAGKFSQNPYAIGNKPAVTHVDGFACNWRPTPDVAQQVNVTCKHAAAKITFADRIPSG
jgi:hypothetical protein